MHDMEVEHVLATTCVVAWASICKNKNNKGGMKRVCQFTMTRRVSWKGCTGLDYTELQN